MVKQQTGCRWMRLCIRGLRDHDRVPKCHTEHGVFRFVAELTWKKLSGFHLENGDGKPFIPIRSVQRENSPVLEPTHYQYSLCISCYVLPCYHSIIKRLSRVDRCFETLVLESLTGDLERMIGSAKCSWPVRSHEHHWPKSRGVKEVKFHHLTLNKYTSRFSQTWTEYFPGRKLVFVAKSREIFSW
jgi:hypothetical protein